MLYVSEKSVDGYRAAADALALARIPGGEAIRYQLNHDMRDPANRTWKFAAFAGGFATTDFVDGKFARRSLSGPSRFGGFLDQMSDKWFFLRPTAQLVKNGELDRRHFWVPLIRDTGATAIRFAGLEANKSTDARELGKYKMWSQCIALTAACSPLAHEQPDLVRGLYDIATGFSVASGADLAYNLQAGKILVGNAINAVAGAIESSPERLSGQQLAEVFVINAASATTNPQAAA